MKIIIILTFLLLVLINCGPNQQSTFSGQIGTCTTKTILPGMPLTNGGALISCPDGSSSLISNGSFVLPVQFCPNPTTYPSTFSEVGFCINNQLWGVYSVNNGFLTLIVPGNYSSNGINSSCNFTVGPNCTVTN